jgi:hypothetical protein
MTYNPPSVQVSSVANNRIINISEDTRIPVIVGKGPAKRLVVDYPIVRSSSRFDLLPNSGSGVSYIALTQVASYPGAAVSNTNWHLHYSTSGSCSVYWAGVAGSTIPKAGETYYVSYNYNVPTTQFTPQVFTDSSDIVATYGTEDSATPDITIAANMALENGAPAVMCLQVSGNTAAEANWSTAFDLLKKKSNIAYLVPITSGSAIQNLALTHCLNESAPIIGHERECIFGMTVGTTVAQFVAKAIALKNSRCILVTPSDSITRTSPAGATLTLQGANIAAALSGLITSQAIPASPVTGKIITGFLIPDDQFEPYDMNYMAGNGVCVIYSQSGVVKVRHAVTTDPTSADTREISIISSDDYVRRVTRNKLTDAYIGKGIVISSSTPAAVAGTVAAIWGSMVRQGFIDAYGTKNDPTTGEVPISASQDNTEPTKINVTGSIRFLYPLNYISVTFFIYV